MIDLATMQLVDVATGGSRGDFLHVAPDGRLYVTQSSEVDVFFPLVPPQVIAANPVSGSTLVPAVNSATVTFNSDMLDSASDANAVVNPGNYALTDTQTGQTTPITEVDYDPATRTAHLVFGSLMPDPYKLTVAANVASAAGASLGTAFYLSGGAISSQPGSLAMRITVTASPWRSSPVT